MRRSTHSLLTVAALIAAAAPAAAWDRTGHLVVAHIAWQELSPTARARAAELLAAAPENADLRQLAPESGDPEARRAEHFQLAAYWPDLMRDGAFPERRDRYHRSNWHYINYFFEQRGPELTPVERSDLRPERTNAVERLRSLVPTLGHPSVPAERQAIHLAWVLHLAGDLHQPLHATARVTDTEPRGDRGGNLVELDGDNNLHGFWDSILRSSNWWWWLRSERSYVQGIARDIMEEHPPSAFTGRLHADYEAWARESYALAKERVYTAELVRGRKPPRSYRGRALELAQQRIALAGYRLAALLEARLGDG